MLTASMVISYTLIALAAMMSFWMIALGVNYEQKFFTLFKNAALITIGSLPQTLFFGVIALLPFALFLIQNSLFLMIAITVLLLFGFTWALLVWLDFAQWLFDKYINPKIEGAKVGRGIFNKDGTSSVASGDSAAEKEYRRALLAEGKADYIATAHHQGDEAETVLFRLARNTSPAGLCGIAPVRPFGSGVLVRPILKLSKQMLLELCREERLEFVTDQTNDDVTYARNRYLAYDTERVSLITVIFTCPG